MWSPKSSNHRTHAQSTYQSLPEQPTGWPASPGGAPAGMPSSSALSGVLGELTARPTKLRRTEASAARSAPGLGALLAPNGTSIPFPFALHYDDLPPNSHVPHPQLRRADAPGPQETTAQQPALADAAVAHAAVHEERQAPDNRPALYGRLRTFAELSDAIRNGIWSPGSETPYRADRELIVQFVDGAKKGGAKFRTTKQYAYLLMRFSGWLRQQQKGGLHRVFNDKDELKRDASMFLKNNENNSLFAALDHIHGAKSLPHGMVKMRGYRNHKAPDCDTQFIENAHSFLFNGYASALRAFSAWLHAQGKEGLCETGRLHSQTLMNEAKEFSKTRTAGSAKSVSALRKLRDFYHPRTTDSVEIIDGREIYEVDHQFNEKYENDLCESSGGKRYAEGGTYASEMSSRPMHQMYPSNEQLPDLGSRAEPVEPFYSSMFPLTHEGGWPQAAEGVWIPDTPEQEVTGPAWPDQSDASSSPFEFDWEGALYQADVLSQTHQSNWDLDTFSHQFMALSWPTEPGASSSSFAFDPGAPQPEATEHQHTNAMPQASIPTFDQNDTGLNWNDGERHVPE